MYLDTIVFTTYGLKISIPETKRKIHCKLYRSNMHFVLNFAPIKTPMKSPLSVRSYFY